MKTAMQNLIEDITIEKRLGYITKNAANRILDYINNLYLEKEKNQMLDLIRFMKTNDKMGKSTYNIYDEFCGNNVKSKICEYCANEFIPKSPKMYDIKKYCSMDCREKEYYRRAKAKKEYNKFIKNENI